MVEFLGALEALDVDRALGMVSADIVYRNRGLPPARGFAAFERQLRTMTRWFSGFEVQNHHIASNGPIVLTERTDIITIGKVRIEFWVCGTFEVHDGRITLWRDSFDYVNLTAATIAGVVRALRGR